MYTNFLEYVKEGVLSYINEPYIIYSQRKLLYHTTAEKAAEQILKTGFKTGKELNISEKRAAIFFSDRAVNKGLYARNEGGETYNGQTAVQIAVDIKGLKLLNISYKVNSKYINYDKYRDDVVKGNLENIPDGCVGFISYLDDGKIYEVVLPVDISNARMLHKLF